MISCIQLEENSPIKGDEWTCWFICSNKLSGREDQQDIYKAPAGQKCFQTSEIREIISAFFSFSLQFPDVP